MDAVLHGLALIRQRPLCVLLTIFHMDHHAGAEGSNELLQGRHLLQDLSQQILDQLNAGNTEEASRLITQALNSGETGAVSSALASSTASVSCLTSSFALPLSMMNRVSLALNERMIMQHWVC